MTGDGNINEDALFCNVSDNDFTLDDNSPCIGAGIDGSTIGAYGIGCDANTIWVSIDGNDFTGDGTQNNPYRYIGTAISNATSGAKIKILPGTYSENIAFGNKDLSLIGIGDSDDVIIDGQGQDVGNVITVATSSIGIENLILQNGEHGLLASDCESIAINKVKFQLNDYSMNVIDGSGYTIIDSSVFESNTRAPYWYETDSLLLKNSLG